MADTSLPAPRRAIVPKGARVWVAMAAILAAVAALDPAQLPVAVSGTLGALMHTAPFIAFAVLAVAYMRAAGAESVVAKAFAGPEWRMILFAALAGGLAPFCSCEVIPFVAALLAAGTPLSAVMAFWLSSPLMDPAQFALTSAELGTPFAVAKAAAAVGFGLAGGLAVSALTRSGGLTDPLKPAQAGGCGCGNPFRGAPVWKFWDVPKRRAAFATTARDQSLFLVKWLALAYLLEMLMKAYVPAEWIGAALGGEGMGTVALASVLSVPAYINGYAAVALVSGLVEQGMSQGAAMAFMLGGSVTCIPAAIAVWALVRPPVFALYAGLGLTLSLAAGLIWGAVA